jgi:transposase
MTTRRDARRLSTAKQEALRLAVVGAVMDEGMSQAAASRKFQVSKGSVTHWVGAVRRGGIEVLTIRRRGRSHRPILDERQTAEIKRIIKDRRPEELHLPFDRWTRKAVQRLLAQNFGVHRSVFAVGRYLGKWGFKPQANHGPNVQVWQHVGDL